VNQDILLFSFLNSNPIPKHKYLIMSLLITALNPAHLWFWFLFLQLVLIFAIKQQWLSRDLLLPFEIVLIASAVLFTIAIIPGIVFFTVIGTVGTLAVLFHINPILQKN
jgi:magnesium-transporting ATPase (P-type)